MYSFGFPEMLGSYNSKLVADKEAVKSNIKLLLKSERATLFGDPYFGSQLKRAIYEQSSSMIIDLMIDELYTTLITFIPQIYVVRKGITLKVRGNELLAEVKYTYLIDNTADLYVISLTSFDQY